jgi:hypothetical protein
LTIGRAAWWYGGHSLDDVALVDIVKV